MEWYEALALMMILLAVALAVGVPVALAFLVVNFVCGFVFMGGEVGAEQAARGAVSSLASFALVPVPLFILMGEVMFRTGMAGRAIDAVDRLITRVPGRLSLVAITSGTIFSALTGSSMANAAMLGSTLIPEMHRRRYHYTMSIGPVLGAGGIAVLIPPSGLAVLLGSLSGISIADLLIGGIVPGLMIAAACALYVVVRCSIDPSLAPQYDLPRLTPWQRWRPFLVDVLPLLLIFVVVVASMLEGIATPSEAAALGAVASMVAALCYGRLTFANLLEATRNTAKVSVVVLFIIAASVTFSQILGFSQAIGGALALISQWQLGTYGLIALMTVILLVLGCFVDPVSMMMLTLPFFMPLVRSLGIEPGWFGVIMLVLLELSFITPPFGLLLFVMRGLAPAGTTTRQIYQAAYPFVLCQFIVLGLIVLFPLLVTALPALTR